MQTWHKIVFGDCRDMHEIPNKSIHLMVTSPPYYNAPFDYPGLFREYDQYLDLLRHMARELKRVLADGRIACFVTQDVRIDKFLHPICSDVIRIMLEEGFNYRDRIIWRKPTGYVRISRRSGVFIQHPYPMYFYPDNIYEEILVFQNGVFDYSYIKGMDKETLKSARIDLTRFNREKWYLSVWDITNVLPIKGRIEEGIAAFPDEIPRRLIRLFTFPGETVLDPFLGSGTTTRIARELGRNSYGYELDLELEGIIREKIGGRRITLGEHSIEVTKRSDAKRLRTSLLERIKGKRSVTRSRQHDWPKGSRRLR